MRRTKWLGAVSALALASSAASTYAQGIDVFFLPEDRDAVEERSVVGTREWSNIPGVKVMNHPGGDTDFVIDRIEMWERRAREYLRSQYVHRSSVVISFEPIVRGEYLHLYLERGLLSEAMFLWFDEPPIVQLMQPADGDDSWDEYHAITYREYHFGPGDCFLFSSRFPDMMEKLRDYLGSFGDDPVPPDEIWLDDVSYEISGWIGGVHQTVSFAVSENSGPILDPVKGVVSAVRDCAAVAPVVSREYAMEMGAAAVIGTR